MLKQGNQSIYNEIKWCLLSIPSDFVTEKHVRL